MIHGSVLAQWHRQTEPGPRDTVLQPLDRAAVAVERPENDGEPETCGIRVPLRRTGSPHERLEDPAGHDGRDSFAGVAEDDLQPVRADRTLEGAGEPAVLVPPVVAGVDQQIGEHAAYGRLRHRDLGPAAG